MDIEVQALTTYSVADDGQSVALGLKDTAGNNATLRMKICELGNLVMTLPSVIETALRRRYRDVSLRYTYPLGAWRVEASSDPGHVSVTLGTEDGFGVSFSVPRARAGELGAAISSSVRQKTHVLAH